MSGADTPTGYRTTYRGAVELFLQARGARGATEQEVARACATPETRAGLTRHLTSRARAHHQSRLYESRTVVGAPTRYRLLRYAGQAWDAEPAPASGSAPASAPAPAPAPASGSESASGSEAEPEPEPERVAAARPSDTGSSAAQPRSALSAVPSVGVTRPAVEPPLLRPAHRAAAPVVHSAATAAAVTAAAEVASAGVQAPPAKRPRPEAGVPPEIHMRRALVGVWQRSGWMARACRAQYESLAPQAGGGVSASAVMSTRALLFDLQTTLLEFSAVTREAVQRGSVTSSE